MVFTRNVRYVMIQFVSVLAATFLIAQMVMQMHFVPAPKNVTCYVPPAGGSNITLSYGEWVGFGKIDEPEWVPINVWGYICIIALVTLHSIVVKERSLIQGLSQESGWDPIKMFNDSVYLKADIDFKSFVKYLLKYGFYRYGAELTLTSIALLILARLDFWACLYSVWLVILVLFPARYLPIFWIFFKYFVLLSIPIQYIVALGFWPEKCFGYVEEITKEQMVNTAAWMQVPYGTLKPNAPKMFWDSLVFLFMLCQAQVFEFEKVHAKDELKKSSPKKGNRRLKPQRPITTFGLARYASFYSLPIICAAMFYMAATTHISLFSFVHAFGFIMILWFADFYFLRPVLMTQTFWRYLIILNVFTIFLKTIFQSAGCILKGQMGNKMCWLVQMLGIICLEEINSSITFFRVPLIHLPYPDNKLRSSCLHSGTTAGIHYDVLSFIVLMFHKRFLLTKYFLAMSREAALDLKFSFRAAKILEELNKQEISEMKEKYKKSLSKIHKKMARLKESHSKIRGHKLSEPLTHQEVVTSGDYYMFVDANKDLWIQPEDETEKEKRSKLKDSDCQSTPSTPNVGKLMEAVMKTDIEQALRMADSGSLNSEKSIKSPSRQPEDIVTEKCLECTCSTTISPELDLHPPTEKLSDPTKPGEKKGSGKVDKKTRQKVVIPAVIIVKDEKLLPTVNFDRRKSLTKVTSVTATSKAKINNTVKPTAEMKKESSGTKSASEGRGKCDCTNCKCHLRCKVKFMGKLCLTIRFLIAFINSCMISLCQLFNEIAHDYKYIKKQLQREKFAARKAIVSSPLLEDDDDFFDFLEFSYFMTVSTTDKDKLEVVYQVPIIIRLFISLYEVIMSSFNTVCYLSVLLLQLQNPNILTIILTLMVLLWGALSVPRPTKRFWKTILVYTGVLLILECAFRIPLFEWDLSDVLYSYAHGPFYDYLASRDFSVYYLLVLLGIFLQRRILMNIGLWSDEPKQISRGNIFSFPHRFYRIDLLSTRMYESIKNFFHKLVYEPHPGTPVDVYTAIFLCDFINIFVFIFAFTALNEKQEDGVTKYFFENKIPPMMLIIFIAHCVCIFIDRWIYLRRHVMAKLIFYVVQILVLHLCLFYMLPSLYYRKFNETIFPTLWYWLKSFYFLLSAYQIRRGYPAYVHGHVLCQSYSVVNLYLYQFYLFFPFVFELRTVTDWMWTETTLTLTEWLGMEDIFSTVFVLKCWRNYDNKYSYRRGQKITTSVKFFCGGGIVFLFLLLLLCPLGFFTFGRAAGKTNLPIEMELSFRMASYPSIYTSFSNNIRRLNPEEWKYFSDLYANSPRAINILYEYYGNDVGAVVFSLISQTDWKLTKSIREELSETLHSGAPLSFMTHWELSRETENYKDSFKVRGIYTTTLDKSARESLASCLNTTESKVQSITVAKVVPKFLKVSLLATGHTIDSLMVGDERSGNGVFGSSSESPGGLLDVNFTIACEPNATVWNWAAHHSYPKNEFIPKLIDDRVFGSAADESQRPLVVYTFNDKIFGGFLSYISAQGILGLYTVVLVTFGFMIRKLCRNRVNQVFLDYIPNVDSILQLILDIYFVREHKDGKLEEDLYAKLIFLFRSPETLIKWTRLPEESE
ncbi:piezo-type mechanosensitive ion channel component-like [Planococcus citri]|uniref:piezo-type mechanosensitive ion channel component-like n=1 Tax=Planococcus citri TaxID=170843 RepID=UPI0031F9C59B